MWVALVQLAAGTDVAENTAAIRRLTDGVEADLVVLPEAVMHDFGDPALPLGPVAQPLDGPFVATLAAVARSSGAVVVGGMFERSEDPDRPYNTLVAVGTDGAVLATYRKAHLYDSFGYRESDRLRAGDAVPAVVTVDGVRLGLLTCYDLRFPEQGRALVDAGADVFVVPAAWVRGPLKEDHWQTLLRARAIENTVYVAAAAQTGRAYCGLSQLVDPLGVVVAALGDEEGRLAASLDPARLAAARERNPALRHRRSWPAP
ncbi:carbon-nitrogen hydrolase family protein [Jiangella alba]|uniref:Predicted amidohydrolase n=1 Tax=Jiangella alba TaxID=561176 RepID=A0A1H5PKN9_9ACTN|nr:carbon-nitrogen hydrolase family protein [Jiangella alba]SEF14234.1 Predicted amidohydrolase [Jiangella alba]